MKRFLMAMVCLMTMMMCFIGCNENTEKTTYLEDKVGDIADKYSGWTCNDLATEQFKNEMVSLFNGTVGMDFQTFYDDGIEFDEIIEAPKGHINNSDSVAVRFKLYKCCFSKEHNLVVVGCDVITLFHKNDAISFDRNKKYKISGEILGYIEDVNLWDRSNDRIDMGFIVMKDNKIIGIAKNDMKVI